MSRDLTSGLMDKRNKSNSFNSTGTPLDWLPEPVNRYLILGIVLVGMLFNALFLVASLSSTLRRVAPISFLTAMAICDMGTQLLFGVSWIQQTFQVSFYDVLGLCQLFNYVSVYFASLSLQLGAALAILQLMWSKKPFKVPSLFQARCVICGIAFVNVNVHSYLCWLWEVSVGTGFKCGIGANNGEVFLYFLCLELSISVLSLLVQLVISLLTATVVGNRRLDSATPETRSLRLRFNETDLKAAEEVKAGRIISWVAVVGIFTSLPVYSIALYTICGNDVPSYPWVLTTGTLLQLYSATKPAIYFVISPKVRESINLLFRRCLLLDYCAKGKKSLLSEISSWSYRSKYLDI